MKYAIIKTGGKQHKVSEGQFLRVERIDGQKGDLVSITDVLMVADDQEVKIGQPEIPGASVKGIIVEQGKTRKITVFKSKRRKGYRKKRGHRQPYTSLRIEEIKGI
jgi:large subunit ribosomal protein L21